MYPFLEFSRERERERDREGEINKKLYAHCKTLYQDF
jgi:hypothetical protein